MSTTQAFDALRLPTRPTVPDAVAIDRLTELLVARDRDDAWWRAVALRVDQLGASIAAHETAPDVYCPATREGATTPLADRMRAEHRLMLGEVADLRALVQAARTDPHGQSLVLAGCTEVIAVVRGHSRRAREALTVGG